MKKNRSFKSPITPHRWISHNCSVSYKRLMIALSIVTLLLQPPASKAQLWKKVKDRVKQTVENKVTQKSQDVTTNAMNKAEGAIAGDQTEIDGQQGNSASKNNKAGLNANSTYKAPKSINDYKNYDFVAGDKIIFEPDMRGEADAELPARFKLLKGNAEIQTDAAEKILHLDEGATTSISPLLSSQSYLPQQYTVEFDMQYENPDDYMKFVNYFDVNFLKPSQQYFETPVYQLRFTTGSGVEWAGGGHIRLSESISKAFSTGGNWHHVAIYVNKNIGKVYLDQYRIAASNTLATGAGHMVITIDGRYGIKLKNFRLAAGGSDKYSKVMTDGKFITHGILFDVNSASIKPTSAGAINEVIQMMQAHPELKFEIDGHTDSDGDAANNQTLSASRAAAVQTALVAAGIAKDRLTTKGFGATKPMDSNDTQEGKANNRRVEFIKQ